MLYIEAGVIAGSSITDVVRQAIILSARWGGMPIEINFNGCMLMIRSSDSVEERVSYYERSLLERKEGKEGNLRWDDVIVQNQAISRIGFVKTRPDGRPFITHWAFDTTEYSRERGVSYTPRELQRISEAYWKDKPLPSLGYIGGA